MASTPADAAAAAARGNQEREPLSPKGVMPSSSSSARQLPTVDADATAAPSTDAGNGPGSGSKPASPSLVRVVLLASAGNVLEWMDFSVYAYFAKQIGTAFFPPGDKQDQLIESFSVFAGAFVARPLGGVLFGWIGDRKSKKFSLQLSLFLMALSTTLIGCLPTYKTIGKAAPIILTILRLLQGLAVGGQLVGTLVFIHSHAPHAQQAFYGSLTLAGGVFGVLLGAVVGAVIHQSFSPEAIQSYGFRIPFLCGFLVAGAGFALHTHVPDIAIVEEETGPGSPRSACGLLLVVDSPAAEGATAAVAPTAARRLPQDASVSSIGSSPASNGSGTVMMMGGANAGAGAAAATSGSAAGAGAGMAARKPNPLADLMRENKAELVVATMVLFLWCTAFYECFVWMPTYLSVLVPHAPVTGAFPITTANLALFTLLLPLVGKLCDKVGYHRVMTLGGVILGVSAPFVFVILRRATPAAAVFGQLFFVVGLSLHGGGVGYFLLEEATTSPHLYTAIALIYNIAQATFGGVASLVSTSLAKAIHGLGAGLWLSLISFISVAALVGGYHPRFGCITAARRRRRQAVVAAAPKPLCEVGGRGGGGEGGGREGEGDVEMAAAR